MTSVADLLRAFESLLVHRHRFALSAVVLCVDSVVHDLQDVQRALTAMSASVLAPVKQSADLLSSRLGGLIAVVPLFLGERELTTLLSALQEFVRLSDGLAKSDLSLQQAMKSLSRHSKALAAAVTRNAAVCALLTKKRNHLAKFLEEAGQVLQNSHSRRVKQYQEATEQFTAEFKLTLKDELLQHVKQLRFDIGTIETSISTMLLPHLEICRTITTANAQVQATGSTFSKAECHDIDTFVRTAARLKSGDVAFRSVLQDASKFLARLALFEQAASKDAFLVCSSALKLQFRESVDQELFLAYVEDWVAKHKTLQLTESSREYQAATSRLQELKVAIKRAHQLAQTSQEKLTLDDPTQKSLAQEVARIFHDEGGVLTRFDFTGCA